MSCKAVASAFWKPLATSLARMLVSITRIGELCTSLEVLKDQCYVESAKDVLARGREWRVEMAEGSKVKLSADDADTSKNKEYTDHLACDPSWRTAGTV